MRYLEEMAVLRLMLRIVLLIYQEIGIKGKEMDVFGVIHEMLEKEGYKVIIPIEVEHESAPYRDYEILTFEEDSGLYLAKKK